MATPDDTSTAPASATTSKELGGVTLADPDRRRAFIAALQRDLNLHLERLGSAQQLAVDGEWDEHTESAFRQVCRVLGIAAERNARTFRLISGTTASFTREERARAAKDGAAFAAQLRRQFAEAAPGGVGGTPLPGGEAQRAFVAALQRDLNRHMNRLRTGITLAVDGRWDVHTERAFRQVCRVLGIEPERSARTYRLISGAAASRTPEELAKAKTQGAAFARKLRAEGIGPHIVVGGRSLPKDERAQAFIAALQRDLNQHLVRLGSPSVLAVDGDWGKHTARAYERVCTVLGIKAERSMRAYRIVGAALAPRTPDEIKRAADAGAAFEKELREQFKRQRETMPAPVVKPVGGKPDKEKPRKDRPDKDRPRKDKPRKDKMARPSDERVAAAIRRAGGRWERHIITASRRTKVPVALLCAFLEHESGFQNVFGHDKTTRNPVRSPDGSNLQVTKKLYDRYLHFRNRGFGVQGVGPMQLTTGSFQDRADELGGCWRPGPNIIAGAEVIVLKIKQQGGSLSEGIRAYNGSGPRAEAYRDAMLKRMHAWEAKLDMKGAVSAGPRVFRVTAAIIEGQDVKAFQRALNARFKDWHVKKRIGVDGKFGNDTRRAAREVAFGLGLERSEFRHGFGPAVRGVIANPRKRTAAQKAEAKSRDAYRAKLRRRYATPQVSTLLRGNAPPKVAGLLRVIADASQAGLVVTSTTGGKHTATSLHYQGRAIDLGVIGSPFTTDAQRRFVAFQHRLARHPQGLAELIGPDVHKCVKNGAFMRYDAKTEAAHKNHLHVAM